MNEISKKAELLSLLDTMYEITKANTPNPEGRYDNNPWKPVVVELHKMGEDPGYLPEDLSKIVTGYLRAMEKSKAYNLNYKKYNSWKPFLKLEKQCVKYLSKQVAEKLNADESTDQCPKS